MSQCVWRRACARSRMYHLLHRLVNMGLSYQSHLKSVMISLLGHLNHFTILYCLVYLKQHNSVPKSVCTMQWCIGQLRVWKCLPCLWVQKVDLCFFSQPWVLSETLRTDTWVECNSVDILVVKIQNGITFIPDVNNHCPEPPKMPINLSPNLHASPRYSS